MNRHVILSAALALLLAGCGVTHIHRLTEEKFPRKGRDAEVKLYVNKVVEKHVEIALINSFAAEEDSPEARRKQLLDIQKKARGIGADAVMSIRRLENKGRGWVPDERIPFSAYEQGKFTQSFLRGTAIVYRDEETTPTELLDEVQDVAIEAGTAGPEGIPTVSTEDERAENEIPPAPETP